MQLLSLLSERKEDRATLNPKKIIGSETAVKVGFTGCFDRFWVGE